MCYFCNCLTLLKDFKPRPVWLQGLPVLFMETCCTIGNKLDFTLKHYCELEYKQGLMGNFRSQRKSWEIWLQKWNRLKQFLPKEYETVKEIDSEEDNEYHFETLAMKHKVCGSCYNDWVWCCHAETCTRLIKVFPWLLHCWWHCLILSYRWKRFSSVKIISEPVRETDQPKGIWSFMLGKNIYWKFWNPSYD